MSETIKPKRGGKRVGAGRPRGAKAKKAKLRASVEALTGGTMPLDVMLEAMMKARKANDLEAAAEYAAKAAPYLHPRLAMTQHSGDQDSPVVVTGVPTVSLDDVGITDKQLLKFIVSDAEND